MQPIPKVPLDARVRIGTVDRASGRGGRNQRGRGSRFIVEGGKRPRNCRAGTPAESLFYSCTTTQEEMVKLLAARGIRLPNFAYDFKMIEGECRLNDSNDGFFYNQTPFLMNLRACLSEALRQALFGLLLNDAQRNKMKTAEQPIEYRCLVRATNGKKTISTSVGAKDHQRFQASYATILKAHMTALKKRERKDRKKAAEDKKEGGSKKPKRA
ncbi:hypothetical protein GOBAR_DD11780 [Gossypium barbadense]|nr:hypothetical protein GOBAR_DD11780 [Gossypium barbadense]